MIAHFVRSCVGLFVIHESIKETITQQEHVKSFVRDIVDLMSIQEIMQ